MRSRGRLDYSKEDSLFERLDDLSKQAAELSRRFNEVMNSDIKESLAYRFEQLSSDVQRLSNEARKMRRKTYENFVISTMGLDQANISQIRYAPVRIYLGEDNPEYIEYIERAAKDFLEYMGFTASADYPAENGSWYKKLIARSKDAISLKEA